MLQIIHIIVMVLNSIARHFINIVTLPILAILRRFIPNLTSYLWDAYNFITNYLLKGFQFVKMVILNLTGLDHNIWNLVVITFGILLSIYATLLGLKLAYNIWRTFQGSNGAKQGVGNVFIYTYFSGRFNYFLLH